MIFLIHRKSSIKNRSYISRGFNLDRFLTALLCYSASIFGILLAFFMLAFSIKYIINYLILLAIIMHFVIVISWVFDRKISTAFRNIFILSTAAIFASFILLGQEGIILLTMFLVAATPMLYLAYKGISFQAAISRQNEGGYGF